MNVGVSTVGIQNRLQATAATSNDIFFQQEAKQAGSLVLNFRMISNRQILEDNSQNK